jgi:hypothetical protein
LQKIKQRIGAATFFGFPFAALIAKNQATDGCTANRKRLLAI